MKEVEQSVDWGVSVSKSLQSIINHGLGEQRNCCCLFFPSLVRENDLSSNSGMMSSINNGEKMNYLGSSATFVVCRIPERDDALVWYPLFHSFPLFRFIFNYLFLFLWHKDFHSKSVFSPHESSHSNISQIRDSHSSDDDATITERLKLWKAATLLSLGCWHLTNWNRQVVHKTVQ